MMQKSRQMELHCPVFQCSHFNTDAFPKGRFFMCGLYKAAEEEFALSLC